MQHFENLHGLQYLYIVIAHKFDDYMSCIGLRRGSPLKFYTSALNKRKPRLLTGQ